MEGSSLAITPRVVRATVLLSVRVEPFSSVSFDGLDTVLYGVNGNGTAVGWYMDAAGDPEGLIDKNGALNTFDYPGSLFTRLYGISDRGQIVGTADVPVEIDGNPAYEQIGFVATPVPLPTTGSLLLTGLAGLWIGRRRRLALRPNTGSASSNSA
jgi:hypothetical protein